MVRHFLDLAEIDAGALRLMLDESERLKRGPPDATAAPRPLAGKVLALIFDRPSTRTRVSFDVAMRELGGETILLTGEEMQRRPRRDHRRYGEGALPLRRRDHDPHARPWQRCASLPENATVPVINGLTAALPSLPGDGRRHDLRGAPRPDRGKNGRLARRRQQCAALLGRTPPNGSTSASGSPPRRSWRRRRGCSPGRANTAPR